MKKMIPLFVLLSAVILSCAPATSSRYREGSNVGQDIPLTVQDERRLTEEALPKMLKDYPPAGNRSCRIMFPISA